MANRIKALVFDLGGVLLNISYQKTIERFRSLGVPNPEIQFSKAQQSMLFEKFEKGEISEGQWLDEMEVLCQENANREQILEAWNSMLLDFPMERLNALKKLKESYPLFLLSNTNHTHIEYCRKNYHDPVNWAEFEGLFNQVFLSYEVGMRKPDPNIFEFVQETIGYEAKEIWYIDDSPQHIETAHKLDWNANHLTEDKDVLEFLKDL